MTTFGIIGTNTISDWFVGACARTGGRARPTVVHSRSADTGEAFARRHGLEASVTDLDALFARVDAVYVASPNLLHHRHAVAALQAGRHVLVEKTMGASLAEVDDILRVASQRGLVAMEAQRNVHAPAHHIIRDALPELGAIRHARLEKHQYSSRYDAFRRGEVLNAFNPALGNAALADIGVYPLATALDLFGTPRHADGVSVHLANGFEAGGTRHLVYPDAVVDVSWSKVVAGVAPSVIAGEDGSLLIDDVGEPRRIVLQPRGGQERTLFETDERDQAAWLAPEVLDFVAQVEAGASEARWADLSRAVRSQLDAHLGV